jgi:hypothetical protein
VCAAFDCRDTLARSRTGTRLRWTLSKCLGGRLSPEFDVGKHRWQGCEELSRVNQWEDKGLREIHGGLGRLSQIRPYIRAVLSIYVSLAVFGQWIHGYINSSQRLDIDNRRSERIPGPANAYIYPSRHVDHPPLAHLDAPLSMRIPPPVAQDGWISSIYQSSQLVIQDYSALQIPE